MADRSLGTVAIWALAAALGALALVRLAGPDGDDASAGAPVRIDRPGAGAPASPRHLFVHVAGAVRRPGLVRMPQGSRVAEAVARAGGPLPRADLTLVNLAATVEDGQQVVVPAGAAGAGAPAAGGALAPGVKPSLGTATLDQLDEIDGIGPTLAERILEYRTENGGFGSLDELKEVDGIGEKRFETLREALQP
jgi:competence protein ComEA